MNEFLAVGGFVALFALMAVRVPIGIAMGLVGIGGFGAVIGMGPALNLLSQSPISTITDFNLTLIPFFVLMGVLATNSGMSSELFRAGRAWLGGFRGGLGLASVGACGGFAAICGSSVATAATMTKIAYPEMKQAGYSDAASTGIIAAGGTLGILIPPSVVLAIYGFITETDIGQLFIAGVVPGILAVLMYMATVRIWYGRQLPAAEPFRLSHALTALKGIWAVGLLFIAVILSILFRRRHGDRGRRRRRPADRPHRHAPAPPDADDPARQPRRGAAHLGQHLRRPDRCHPLWLLPRHYAGPARDHLFPHDAGRGQIRHAGADPAALLRHGLLSGCPWR